MPAERVAIAFTRTYSPSEHACIAAGVVPESMDDKWFVFYEAPWLHLHRSWTGLCVYQVRFEARANGFEVVEALAHPGHPSVKNLELLMSSLLR